MTDLKKCFKCNQLKERSCFYAQKKMGDGLLGKCKECCKKDVRENYVKNKPQYQEYEKNRAMLPHRVKAREEYRMTEQGAASVAQSKQKWLDDNRIKRAAHTIFRNWKRYNKEQVPEGCVSCGVQGKRLEAHHDDYSKPLEVRYLCGKCHRAWHRENGSGING